MVILKNRISGFTIGEYPAGSQEKTHRKKIERKKNKGKNNLITLFIEDKYFIRININILKGFFLLFSRKNALYGRIEVYQKTDIRSNFKS